MAARGIATTAIFMMLLCAACASPGRKMLQDRRSTKLTGADTAAMSATQANIKNAVAISTQPGTPAVMSVNPKPQNPNPKKTDQGTGNQGVSEAKQAAAAAAIKSFAAGNKPVAQALPTASDVPGFIAAMPKAGAAKVINSYRATNMQSATAAGIEAAANKQGAMAVIKADAQALAGRH